MDGRKAWLDKQEEERPEHRHAEVQNMHDLCPNCGEENDNINGWCSRCSGNKDLEHG